jgi:hypothetical protein
MPFDLISTFVVGAVTALFTWLFFRTIRRPMPRRALPLAIGLAMIAYAIWSEYSWGWRTADLLPADVEVIDRLPDRSPWRPWTYLYPRVTRMIAVDRGSVRRNPAVPGVVMVDLVLLERWMPTRRAVRMIDCPGARMADVTNPAAFEAGGLPPADAWSDLRMDGPIYGAVCAGQPDPTVEQQ